MHLFMNMCTFLLSVYQKIELLDHSYALVDTEKQGIQTPILTSPHILKTQRLMITFINKFSYILGSKERMALGSSIISHKL